MYYKCKYKMNKIHLSNLSIIHNFLDIITNKRQDVVDPSPLRGADSAHPPFFFRKAYSDENLGPNKEWLTIIVILCLFWKFQKDASSRRIVNLLPWTNLISVQTHKMSEKVSLASKIRLRTGNLPSI
jgi:hypothetical protein